MKKIIVAGLILAAICALVVLSRPAAPSPAPFSSLATQASAQPASPAPASHPSVAPAPMPSVAAPTAALASRPTTPPAPIPAAVSRATTSAQAAAIGTPPAPSVWERLETPTILDTAFYPQADGSVVRARLVSTGASKYPLAVFEGTLPAGNREAADTDLQNSVAKVASHVIARPRDGMSDADFAKAITAAGLKVGERLGPDGPYLVEIPDPGISSVNDAVGALQRSGAAAYAEPDYLVHASDIPASDLQVDVVNGIATYPQLALDERTIPPPVGPTFEVTFLKAETEQRLTSLPPASRVLTFDAPTFLGGADSYNPYLEEQSFRVSTATGAYVQSAYTSGYPNNGSLYAGMSGFATDFTVQHRESLPFSIFSVDLAEYSTNYPYPKTVGFTGYKADGTTVFQSFTTDGIIDGTGTKKDFETFVFHSGFTNLKKVTASTSMFMADNIALLVEGSESLPTPAPNPPLLYDVDWEAPTHTAGQLTAVSGAYAPSSIYFGTPTVRSSVGPMNGQALELKGNGYQQIRFGVLRNAKAYRLEMDAYINTAKGFSVIFDTPTVQTIRFMGSGDIDVYESRNSVAALTGKYPVAQLIRIAVDIDMVKRIWELSIDGAPKFRRPFNADFDVEDIRLHADSPGTGVVGLDNFKLYGYETADAPVGTPRLTAHPLSLSFPAVSQGGRKTWPVRLSNTGGQTLNIQSIVSNSGQFLVDFPAPVALIPGGEFYTNVTFTPSSAGTFTGTLTVRSNDPGTPSLTVPLSGSASGTPQIAVSPANLFVTMPGNSTGTETFTLGNLGSGSLNWNLALKGGSLTGGSPTDPSRTPNDSNFASLWAMAAPQIGRGGIDAVHAWSVTTGSAASVVAVIDTGVDRTHPELQGNLAVNTGEIPNNGIDDDRNGYIDDVNGWDFYNRDADPSDGHGHGTHVAGTIGARGHNSLGVAGVAWNVRLLPIKFLSDSGSGYTSDAVASVNYATRMGARISNNSWGGGGYSQALYDAISATGATGSIFVAAAGNDSLNNDTTPQYPAGYNLDNIIAVASTDEGDGLSYFSNYGATSVDLGAPGSNVLSLRPGGQYAYLSGTSMATPHVAGSIELLLSKNPTMSYAQIRQLLYFGADSLPSLSNRAASGSRLNVYRSLKSTVPEWLRPQVTSGTVTAGQSALVPLSVNTASLAPGTYDQVIVLSSNDPARPSIDLPVQLKVVAPSGYRDWQANQFTSNNMLASATETTLWGDESDPDADRLSNLLEYLTGGDPLAADGHLAPKIVTQGADALFEFQIRDDLEGVGYRVEWSPDLATGNWRSSGLTVVENTTEGMPPGLRRLRIQLDATPTRAAFFRLVSWSSL